MIKVFISSPYTNGSQAENVKVQIDMAHKLMDLGFAPFTPLLSHFLEIAKPRPYEDWLKLDIEFLKVCDCILRLPGKSPGADRELKISKDLDIPVFYSLKELSKNYGV